MNFDPQESRRKPMALENTYQEIPVSWNVDHIEISATLAKPNGKGQFPAIIFVAGSGPTDRNWNTPLIPGTNGSGALLAQAFAENGFITLRYDKLGSGHLVQETIKRMTGKISMQSFLEELAGGIRLLADREDVDAGHIFILTNSEGCVHAINYQTQDKFIPIAGMALTSAFAHPAGVLAHSQIAAQLAAVPGGSAMLSAYDSVMEDFKAGRPVQPDENLPEGLRNVILTITQPANQPFARELWNFDPKIGLASITIPVLVVIGKKDIQVDWQTDGPFFEAIAKEHGNITVVYAENANHVLKYEPKPRPELTAADATATYSAEGIPLDTQAFETIHSWLKAQL
jgi:alpha-beta hydrolase superfamily lysophospholipase